MLACVKEKTVETRKYPRKKCSVRVGYADYFETNRITIISDISQGGAFIHTHDFLDIGQDILMKVKLPGLPKPMAIIGEVVRHHPDGMGVKFNLGLGTSAIRSFITSI